MKKLNPQRIKPLKFFEKTKGRWEQRPFFFRHGQVRSGHDG
ncbi:hypothetical protein FHS83_001751 [Rhizomicrobium palustre]|uniref:Uncharacterized protein n=1 Tax=Rhizomicrobium palustre TaxID=189966 RepID=A0A846MYQ3_9PROT|nr:hypothetical protein [Rhizomicrobium palustre]